MHLEKTSARVRALGAVTLLASALAGQAAAGPVVTEGCSDAPSKASALYTNLGNQANGAYGLVVATATANSKADVHWGTTTREVTFSPIEFNYDGSILSGKARGVTLPLSAGVLGDANFVRIELKEPSSEKSVTFELRNAFVGSIPVGTLTSKGKTCWTVSGLNLNTGFSIKGDLTLKGDLPGQNHQLRIDVGYVAPPDADAPVVTDVVVNPDPVLLNGTAQVSAIVNDVETGGSVIRSAEYALNGGTWLPMAAVDSAFDTSLEGVQASFTASQIGENRVCVRGTDAAGNTSDPFCQTFRTNYRFEGFDRPIDMGMLNTAKAGQGIAVKWRLTDAHGTPVTHVGSFAALYSSANACSSGLLTDAVEEDATGTSGLQYGGDGYWQFNWRTPSSYAGSCRGMYVKFEGGQISPLVLFQFKR